MKASMFAVRVHVSENKGCDDGLRKCESGPCRNFQQLGCKTNPHCTVADSQHLKLSRSAMLVDSSHPDQYQGLTSTSSQKGLLPSIIQKNSPIRLMENFALAFIIGTMTANGPFDARPLTASISSSTCLISSVQVLWPRCV